MQSIRGAVLFAFLLFFSLLATTAAFPVLPSRNDAVQPPVYNASLASAGLITFTKLVLVVNDFGQHIPEDEVDDTLKAANRAIHHEVETHPEHRILNDEFTYRRKEGHMLIFIAANTGEEVTWSQLSRILHALHAYMTGGPDAPDDHYRALDFQVRTLSQKTIAFGLVRYFPSESSNAQERALPSRPISISSANVPANNTISDLSSYFEYPIPNTPITLVFFSLGLAIPSIELGAGLTNALRQVRSHESNRPYQAVPDNSYWYSDNVSHVWLMVLSVASNTITWQQLQWAVSGILHWMEQDDRCRELAFDIDVVGKGTIASGNIGYDQPSQTASYHFTAMAERTGAAFNTSLQLPDNATNTPTSMAMGECTVIPNMGVALCFRTFGVQIPAQEVKRMFDGALAKIASLGGRELDDQVSNNLFHYGDVFGDTSDVMSVTIEGDPRATITWMGLGRILTGLWTYMEGTRLRLPNQNPKYQALDFDIITFGNVKMGVGSVRYTLAGSQAVSVERRANAISTSPLLTNSTLNVSGIAINGSFRLLGPSNGRAPGTSLNLYFLYHGDAIPSNVIYRLFSQALIDLPGSEGLVTGDSFHSRTPYSKIDGGVSIDIEWLSEYKMTYGMLNRILLDLRSYIVGYPDGHQHFEDLEFEMTTPGEGRIGNGKLWYIPGHSAFTGPMLETGGIPNENPLILPGSSNSTLSQLQNSTQSLLGAATSFRVPNSPMTLWISRQSKPLHGIGIELFSVFTSALQSITPIVDAHPNAPIVRKTYKYSKPSEQGGRLALNLRAAKDQEISWQDLKDVIEGLSKFYDYDPETGWYRSFASTFDISKDGKGTIGSGDLSLVDSTKS